MTNFISKYIAYRQERKHIKEVLSPENNNFW